MKNTILKMAGTKDEKSFYKKYPTEAAFLKAHPKAKAELKKFATGGQIGKDIGAGLYGAGEGLLDTITLGATDQLTDMGYKALQKAGGSTEDEIREQDSIHGYSQAAGAIGGGFLNPAGVGAAINQTGKGLGEGISKGSESEDWARTTGQVLNTAGQIGSMAYGNFGSSAGKGIKTGITTNAGNSSGNFLNPSNMMGQTQFGVAKYGGMYNMGGMQQYAMGGFGNPKNPQASMGVNPNNPQISMSINKVNNNPYESSPGYKAAEAAKFYSTGPLYGSGAARGLTSNQLVNQYNTQSKMPGYEGYGNLKYVSGNINNGTGLFQKNENGKTSNWYYSKTKDGSFGLFPEVKTQVNNTQVNSQVNPQINPVNNIQNTTQANTQPENRGEYTNFGQPYTSVKFKGAHGYSGNDVTYKYYDPATNREINQDLNKSFDPKGNFVPSFLEQQPNAKKIGIGMLSEGFEEGSQSSNTPIITNKYGGKMQYAMGGTQYANGGTGEISAEVEGGGYNQNGYNQDGENAIGPNGEFTQFSGPTHAQGGIKTDMAPGTMIFSDKLKMPGSKKSFAALNKLYDTNKEDNVLSNEKSNNTLKLTAMLMRDAKLKQSLALFQEQEQFKQDKVAAYAKRMGVQIPSQDNEQMEPQGMPEQSEGEMAMAMHGGMMNYMAKGGLIKRADGSYSKRGLWDNIRANAGSGKAPTKEMLKQEAKINKKAMGGYMYANGGTNNPGFNALPQQVQQNILFNMAMGGQMNNPMFAEGGKLPQDILKSRLESHMSLEEANNYLDEYGEGGYVVKRSNERKGKTHVVIGPDGTKKYFGDPNMGQKENSKNGKEAFYARHKTNLANNPYFRAYAKKTWAEGGITEEEMYNDNSVNYKMEMGGFNPMNQGLIQGINSYQNAQTPVYNHGGMYVMGGIQESDYQTDPGKLSDIQRQLRVVKQQISVIQPDSQYVPGPLAKLRGLEKDLTIRQNNHPEFKKAMGGRFPMYEDGGFDWANAGKQAGQYALQNAGNIYNLYRSTQDNSKLNLSRMTPTLLDKTQDLANNQRMYSEGKRQTAEASQGNASTYLNNMYANRASRLANDLNVNTTYGNLNSQIENSAKLYNAGATDKETMFKLQAEGMNRNLKGQALSGMSQNLLNQINSNKQDDLDQQRLGIQKDFYKEYWANENRKNQEKINKNKEEDED